MLTQTMEGDSESEGPERGAEDELRCEISLEAEDNCNSSCGLDINTSCCQGLDNKQSFQ